MSSTLERLVHVKLCGIIIFFWAKIATAEPNADPMQICYYSVLVTCVYNFFSSTESQIAKSLRQKSVRRFVTVLHKFNFTLWLIENKGRKSFFVTRK